MTSRGSISDYTEQEFLQLLTEICEVSCQSEDDHSVLVRHFQEISEHPEGSDLIFYPADDADDSPEGILKTVKEWRRANGLPGFKEP
ncbi:bacteriocin immunity protein [Pseudomonas chlororaphis]|uniref:bacteriocin immunity protein n=1 Tax=Pseudomonas chlororaphis TaxID=587753 RepID=UPI000F54F488|nr:bacteriocin immunity protein [Pseudomonas chlororaphis]AZD47732.1 Colicin immunity protein [Pseudomonas chlororaphis subsp. aurantiaca]